MLPRKRIKAFVQDIVQQFRPAQVILFGSYAYGKPTPDSDVDLLVVMRHRGPAPKMAAKIRLACPLDLSLDILVRSPAKLRQRLKMGDDFFREVTTKGIVLYESEDARVG
ncbi:MAG TPA: nucleotidyltransferase domain-containing protein [Tepidisphaeraceae bacterium]|jgi:predicted nucleotidyltransferase